jgi:predicted amidohydrolase
MRVAAYQAPLRIARCKDGLDFIRAQVQRCESEDVSILCCPEAILGGLADNSGHPSQLGIAINNGDLNIILSPIASATVTTIVGFTEIGEGGRIYNSAAVFQFGEVIGRYRKRHPAIRRSIYSPGSDVPVFRAGDLAFGIVICNDSNYSEPARLMAAQGARALFVPTNNSLPLKKADPEVIGEARRCDTARAVENNMWVIRADVAGQGDGLISFGSSGIVDPNGNVVLSAVAMQEELLIAKIDTVPREDEEGTCQGWC